MQGYIKRDIFSLINKPWTNIKNLAKIIGELMFACYGVEYGLLHTRMLEKEKIMAFPQHANNFKARICLTNSVIPDLKWWLHKMVALLN